MEQARRAGKKRRGGGGGGSGVGLTEREGRTQRVGSHVRFYNKVKEADVDDGWLLFWGIKRQKLGEEKKIRGGGGGGGGGLLEGHDRVRDVGR